MDPSETPRNQQESPSSPAGEIARLEARVSELQRERDQLVAIVDILQEISASLHFVDILQAIARKLGESFGLDRCSIFLTGEASDVRLVASYEDPTIRNLVVDLERYPELRRAFESGETVFVPDAVNDPMFAGVKSLLDLRNVRSIIVVPIRWRGAVIGAIFLRTERDAEPFLEGDVRFCQVVASLTAKALHNAHRFEDALQASENRGTADRRGEVERVALLAFIRRLLERYSQSEAHIWAETVLPSASDEELNRLVSVTMQVLEAEAQG